MSSTKKAFNLVKLKAELAEVGSDILEILIYTHAAVGKAIERATHAIPAIGLLISGIGHLSAIVRARNVKTRQEKINLGIKVSSGLTTLAIAIAALAVPGLSVPLVLAGTAVNLFYGMFSIHKRKRRVRALEKQIQQISSNNPEYIHRLQALTTLKDNLHEQRHAVFHKSIVLVVSTIIVAAGLAMLISPIAIIPAATIMTVTITTYLTYHYGNTVISGLKKWGNQIKNILTPKPKPSDSTHATPTPKVTDAIIPDHSVPITQTQNPTEFLAHEKAALASIATAEAVKTENTFAKAHQIETQTANTAKAVHDFLAHEDRTLETISTHHVHHRPLKQEDEDEGGDSGIEDNDSDDGGNDGTGGSTETLTDEGIETDGQGQPEPHLHPNF